MLELRLNLNQPTNVTPKPTALEAEDWGSVTGKIAAGDKQAFATYYVHFFDVMFSEAQRVTNLDESTCLDIVQDSMLKVIRSIKRIDNGQKLVGWSRAVVKNSAFDLLRKRQRERNHLTQLVSSDREASTDGSEIVSDQARILWLEQQLLELPTEIQQLFSLRYRMGWTLKKIAGSLGMQTGAVDGKLRRAVKQIKTQADLENTE